MGMVIFLAVVVVVVFWLVGAYNGLIALKNRVLNAWKQIDVQLKRRHDLIPNLIETVNTMGLPIYARQIARNDGSAIDVKTEASILPVNKRPRLAVRIFSSY